MTRQERAAWLKGRKVHASIDGRTACGHGLASGRAYTSSNDLRKVTCPRCRRAVKELRERLKQRKKLLGNGRPIDTRRPEEAPPRPT